MLLPVRVAGCVFAVVALIGLLPNAMTERRVFAQAVATGATLSGSIVDAALNPVRGVAVALDRDGRVLARTTTDGDGKFRFSNVAPGSYQVRAQLAGFTALAKEVRVPAGARSLQLPLVMARPGEKADAVAPADAARLAAPSPAPAQPTAPIPNAASAGRGSAGGAGRGGAGSAELAAVMPFRQSAAEALAYEPFYRRPEAGDTYTAIEPNRFHSTRERPLSTFGADVDTASYSIVRRFLSSGQLPPREAVRVEELVNYFRFAYAEPRDGRPITITTEIGDCPWAPAHKLVLIGAHAKAPVKREITGRNITLLVDVSGSMAPPDRLPLLKTAFATFVDTLRPDDTLSIVTYAGTSGVALPPTPLRRRDVIQRAIANLNAGGSTNGAHGLITAYRIARDAFIPGGVNRVILATDGDFNVGITSQGDLQRLIERERDSGIFLSVIGVGSGNLQDRTMEMLADKGNGNYSYFDSMQEARRVLIREGDATLEAVAKDVKFQVEFNPAAVASWKLLGYEDRALRPQDFNDDRKDAGEMGAGHTVTVLYEVIPVGVRETAADGRPAVDPLRYQTPAAPSKPAPAVTSDAMRSGEWLQVKTRYKQPESETSELMTTVVRPGARVQHLPLASAVAEFALLLRDAPRSQARWDTLARRVQQLELPPGIGADREGFKELVEIARGLARRY